MKKLILTVMITFASFNLFATEKVRLENQNDMPVLIYKNKTYELQVSGGKPEFRKVIENFKKGVDLIIYYSGTAGTFQPVEVVRAIIIDRKTGESLGDFPYEYKIDNGKGFPQPKWKSDDKKISIEDETFDIKKDIQLPK
ncbi:MAG: hypothetical protein COW00_00320 [Bdellovibrio sp. CG12_big_fil_rev_8_21_14_0_65_39_13]|nr:MAG: hypothetical protein COW78_04070 [Bdellovibrio sp. CG22_combo_CG10-13_8_21_14_all_39_27]PIQ62928.1 MAG: hypothetical protein COW00_00320 [Bdellovibrio sp. CG12_big_fil_rev_8_21_14_0_65_39_13]